ncbi:hypothetical protein GCM10009750_23780 [Agromyces salentinus]|uniref:Uncharacterized protein n=1 Tax=Agromyces salentinus TaxID=269421 RepID=A0ABN2MTE4_9MICO
MPFGRVAMFSFGHDSSGMFQGRSSRAGSVIADVIESEPLIVLSVAGADLRRRTGRPIRRAGCGFGVQRPETADADRA